MEATSPPPGPQAPAGWYPDPEQVQTQRFWDGSEWTEQRAPLGNTTPPDDDHIDVEVTPAMIAVLLGAVAAIVSVFLPFVESNGPLPVAHNALIHRAEGVMILVLGVVAILALYRRLVGARWWWATAALGALMIAVLVFVVINRPEVSYFLRGEVIPNTTEKPDFAIGVYLAAIGALLVTVGGLALPRKRLVT